jgi:hypothetical protein
VTPDDMTHYEKFLFRRYVRRDGRGNSDFFYKIMGMHPYQPGGVVCSTEETLLQFEVQKFYRDKFTEATTRPDEGSNAVKVKTNAKVEQHVMRNDRWICVDKEASFFLDVAQFEKEFVADTD